MLINEKLKLKNTIIPNRVVIQPMEGCDGTENGGISELTRRRYVRFAESGAGIIWFEATAVCESGKANPRQLFLKEDNIEEYKQLLAEMKQISHEKFGYEPILILQATHSGRYSKPNGFPEPIIAYSNPVYEQGKEKLPYHIITDEECDALPEKYQKTAMLAAAAGFDGIDVKCCHGYLFNEFLSAYDRKGKYGGSFEKRTALFFSCIDAVKEVLPENMFITSRLSAYDGFDYPYGFGVDSDNEINLSETKKVISVLEKKGIELINITIGNPYLIPHINRPFIGSQEDGMIGVERIVNITSQLQKEFPHIKMVMSALTFLGANAVDYAEECLEQNKCQLTGFGRMAFAYPQFYCDYLKKGKLDEKKVCIKCGTCSKMMRAGGVAGCPIRDSELYLPVLKECKLTI